MKMIVNVTKQKYIRVKFTKEGGNVYYSKEILIKELQLIKRKLSMGKALTISEFAIVKSNPNEFENMKFVLGEVNFKNKVVQKYFLNKN